MPTIRLTAPRLVAAGVAAAVGWAAFDVSQATVATALPGVSNTAVAAYVEAAGVVPASCGLDWRLLAAFGAVESGHGTFGGSQLDATGTAQPPIRGPQLDGEEFALIWDTDGGALDGDPVYDRAVGPVQFIPATWRHYADEGWNPQNIFDGTKATARLVCSVAEQEGRPLTDPAVEEAAIRAYNNSADYVAAIRGFRDDFVAVTAGMPAGSVGEISPKRVAAHLGAAGQRRWDALGDAAHRSGAQHVAPVFDALDPTAQLLWTTLGAGNSAKSVVAELSSDASAGGMVTVQGITVSSQIADQVDQMVKAAKADGVELRGWGWRSRDEQIELRRQFCGTSDYAIFEMPPGDCSPPVAIPGTSNHESGLAVDFEDLPGAHDWLAANAGRFQLYNLPGEPWHYSVDGR